MVLKNIIWILVILTTISAATALPTPSLYIPYINNFQDYTANTNNVSFFWNGSQNYTTSINYTSRHYTNDSIHFDTLNRLQVTNYTFPNVGTISIWILPDNYVDSINTFFRTTINNDNLSWLYKNNQNTIFSTTQDGGATNQMSFSNTNYTQGEWNHLAIVYIDGGLPRAYINGQEPSSYILQNVTQLGLTPDNLTIGASAQIQLRTFNGSMDDFTIYDTNLSPTQIQEIYADNRSNLTFVDLTGTAYTQDHTAYVNDTGAWIPYTNAQYIPLQSTGSNILFNATGWLENYFLLQYDNPPTNTSNLYYIANTYIQFTGDVTGDEITPVCQLNGTVYSPTDTYYSTLTVYNYSLTCNEGTNYPQTNFTIDYNATEPVNRTLQFPEYRIVLNFSTDTTGYIIWNLENADGNCCQIPEFNSTADYNDTTFQYIKIRTAFADGDTVSVRYNPQVNDTLAQYYEFVNNQDETQQENLGVLGTLDSLVWARVFNYADEELFGAVITVQHYPDDNVSNSYIVQRRITQPQSGTASPGTPLALDQSLPYWITVTHPGYETYYQSWAAIDWETDLPLEIKLKPLVPQLAYDWWVSCPSNHRNDSSIQCLLSHYYGGRYRYSTDFTPNFWDSTFVNGGSVITLDKNTHYNDSQNFTLYIYRQNTTTGLNDNKTNIFVNYWDVVQEDIPGKLFQNSAILAAFFFILAIIIAGIVGSLIIINESDTGYYIFSGLIIIIAIAYPVLLPVAAIFILTAMGNLIFSTTRE